MPCLHIQSALLCNLVFLIITYLVAGNPENLEYVRTLRGPPELHVKRDPLTNTTDALVTMDIVGGRDTLANMYRYYVKGLLCGASLIWHDVILSAGHCLDRLQDNTQGGVLVGAVIPNSTAYGAQWRNIVKQVRHPLYRPKTMHYDMMVAKLESPVTNPVLQPVPLNRDMRVPTRSSKMVTVGMGRTSLKGPVSTHLLQIPVRFLRDNTCRRMNGRGYSLFHQTMFCTKIKNGRSICGGDSGSPLLLNGVQIGLTSWSYGCGNPKWPNVFCRVAGGIDWISEQICLLSSNPPEYCANATIVPGVKNIDSTASPTSET